ncbi:MAG: ABC transporter substrate-binding protein [Treponema sp.]|nr:ABC transporter substrate-binding protein [Treponema sp.]
MKTKLLKTFAIGLTVFSILACGKPVVGPNGETIINIRLMNEIRNAGKVIARFQELVKDDPILSMVLPRITFITGGSYRDRLNMSLIAQERFDLMFVGSWQGLRFFIQQGVFADLTEFFNNDEFPGLQKAFPPDFVQAKTMYIRENDGTFRRGIFGINLAEFFEDTRGLIYREDLRRAHNLPPITCNDTLIKFFETVIEAERQIGNEWLGLDMWNMFHLDTPWYWGKHYGVFAQDSTNLFGDQTHIYIGLSPDNRTVLNAVVAGDSPEEFAKMPPGFQYDFITEVAVARANRWNRFMSPHRGTGQLEFRPFLAVYTTLSGFESAVREALDRTPNAEFGFFVFDEAQRNMQPGAIVSDMVSNNWLVVPAWSENIYLTMRFLDWMFGSMENHNLFHYGIEGEDWIAIGDYGFKQTDISESQRFVMQTYSFTANPNFIRKSEFVLSRPELEKRFRYMYDMSAYVLSPLAGFVFNPAGVQTEIANVTALSNEMQLNVSRYDADVAVQRIDRWHREATRVGLERVRAELILQLQEFLDYKYAN